MANGNTQQTGEGGQQRRVPAPAEPSGGSRPQRAPHLRAESRQGVVQGGDGARAMVTRAQRRRARQGQVTRRQLLRVSFWGIFTFGLTGGLGAFLSNFWPRGVTASVVGSASPQLRCPPWEPTRRRFRSASSISLTCAPVTARTQDSDKKVRKVSWRSGGSAPLGLHHPLASRIPLRRRDRMVPLPLSRLDLHTRRGSESSARRRVQWTPWRFLSTVTALW